MENLVAILGRDTVARHCKAKIDTRCDMTHHCHFGEEMCEKGSKCALMKGETSLAVCTRMSSLELMFHNRPGPRPSVLSKMKRIKSERKSKASLPQSDQQISHSDFEGIDGVDPEEWYVPDDESELSE